MSLPICSTCLQSIDIYSSEAQPKIVNGNGMDRIGQNENSAENIDPNYVLVM